GPRPDPRAAFALRRAVQAVTVVLAAAAAVGAVVGVIAFFTSRDKGSTSTKGASPGVVDRTADDPLLRAGNVEFFYASAVDGGRLRALADELGAADTAALRAAGQAVILRRRTTG